MTIIIDASVLVAAVIDSSKEGIWAGTLTARDDIVAPEVALAEASNVLRRLELSGEISPGEATEAQRTFSGWAWEPSNTHPTPSVYGPYGTTLPAMTLGTWHWPRLSIALWRPLTAGSAALTVPLVSLSYRPLATTRATDFPFPTIPQPATLNPAAGPPAPRQGGRPGWCGGLAAPVPAFPPTPG